MCEWVERREYKHAMGDVATEAERRLRAAQLALHVAGDQRVAFLRALLRRFPPTEPFLRATAFDGRIILEIPAPMSTEWTEYVNGPVGGALWGTDATLKRIASIMDTLESSEEVLTQPMRRRDEYVETIDMEVDAFLLWHDSDDGDATLPSEPMLATLAAGQYVEAMRANPKEATPGIGTFYRRLLMASPSRARMIAAHDAAVDKAAEECIVAIDAVQAEIDELVHATELQALENDPNALDSPASDVEAFQATTDQTHASIVRHVSKLRAYDEAHESAKRTLHLAEIARAWARLADDEDGKERFRVRVLDPLRTALYGNTLDGSSMPTDLDEDLERWLVEDTSTLRRNASARQNDLDEAKRRAHLFARGVALDTFVRGTLLAVHIHLTHATAESYDNYEMLGTPRAAAAFDDRRCLIEAVRRRQLATDEDTPSSLTLPSSVTSPLSNARPSLMTTLSLWSPVATEPLPTVTEAIQMFLANRLAKHQHRERIAAKAEAAIAFGVESTLPSVAVV